MIGIDAIKLVRERTGCGLKESLAFVQHVQSWTGARAVKVAELWVSITSREFIPNTPESRPQPVAVSKRESMETRTSDITKGMSLAEWYSNYMETHTYSEWEQLVEECISARQSEQQDNSVIRRRTDGNN